jgi:hypothetical protein
MLERKRERGGKGRRRKSKSNGMKRRGKVYSK